MRQEQVDKIIHNARDGEFISIVLLSDVHLGDFIKEKLTALQKDLESTLHDELENFFIEAGCNSPLMYLHRSPGLLRLKAKHGLGKPKAL